MNRTHSAAPPLAIYALALVAVGLIIYILTLLLSGNESVESSRLNSDGHTQDTKNVAATKLAIKKPELNAQPSEQKQELAYQADTADTEAALQDTETAAERSARLIRETVGITKQQASEAAVNVDLLLAENCVKKAGEQTSLPILYRFESPTIRTSSVYKLRSLVAQFRGCENSVFRMTQNSQSSVVSNIDLAQMRFDELKYFFTQNSVPATALQYAKYP